jgi:hypothetical protein
MGFDPHDCTAALGEAGNDVNAALNLLHAGFKSPAPPATPPPPRAASSSIASALFPGPAPALRRPHLAPSGYVGSTACRLSSSASPSLLVGARRTSLADANDDTPRCSLPSPRAYQPTHRDALS